MICALPSAVSGEGGGIPPSHVLLGVSAEHPSIV
eukprot:CAMPEP_0202898762 /NCGR_PEP_ID=MMETSP1392-20130828/7197_1 /ASSEMBLY_ACC=CAM_ASM_000868 /TAXON_ID=225041 /ORGANISM="Chlamydomonas chlamydogama, Strain SAG 11-48b" /LENGTH=33 /DNA_ID= /DNA_START= /DNA_END= /DNA_ORIENTATION=